MRNTLDTLLETLKQSDNTYGYNTLEKFVKDMAIDFLQSKMTVVDDDMEEKAYQKHLADSDGDYSDPFEFTFQNSSGLADMMVEATAVVYSKHTNGEGGSDNTREVEIIDYEVVGIRFYLLDNKFYFDGDRDLIEIIQKHF